MTIELHGAASAAYVEEQLAKFLKEHEAAAEPLLLHLHGNPVLDSLSPALFTSPSCFRVRELHLDGCTLRSLPDEFFEHLPALEDLALHDNRLESIDGIGQLKKLFSLRLDRNLLATLPASIGECTNLTVLHLDGNPLRELPDEMGNLASLADFGLGSLPELRRLPPALARLESLVVLWVDPATAAAIENVPAAAFEEGPEAVRACLRAQLADSSPSGAEGGAGAAAASAVSGAEAGAGAAAAPADE